MSVNITNVGNISGIPVMTSGTIVLPQTTSSTQTTTTTSVESELPSREIISEPEPQAVYAEKYTKYPEPGNLVRRWNWRQEPFDETEFPIVFGLDGQVSQSNQGLLVDSSQFVVPPDVGPTAGNPVQFQPNPGNSHVHWLRLNATNPLPLDPSKDEEVAVAITLGHQNVIDRPKVESWLASKQLADRVTDIDADLRLACGAFNLVDLSSFLVYDFLISDNTVYAFYERLPFAKEGFYFINSANPQGPAFPLPPPPFTLGNYAAFSYAVPVYRRASVGNINTKLRLRISINAKRNTVSWLVNDNLVMQVTRPGRRLSSREHLVLDHGGVDTDVPMDQTRTFFFGFGTFALLDFLRPPQFPVRDRDGCRVPGPQSGEDPSPVAGKSSRLASALAQIDYWENYEPSVGPLDCTRFGLNGGCNPGNISSPLASEAPAKIVKFSDRYGFAQSPRGARIRVEEVEILRGAGRALLDTTGNRCNVALN